MTKDEKRLEAVMNLMANATTLLTATMSSALGNAVGGAFAGMGEAVGAALGDGEAAHARGDAIRKEVSAEIDAKMRDLVAQAQREIRQAMGETVASLTPAQRKDVLKELRGEVYTQAIEAAERGDFGPPPMTQALSVDDLLKYIAVQDPRAGELVQKILALPQPRVFQELQEAGRKEQEEKEAKAAKAAEQEAAKKARSIKAAPAKITKLPVTARFAPGAKSEIVLASGDPLWLKWDAQLRPGESCENYGIKVESGGSGTATPSGGTVLYPEDGRIAATVTNQEDFALVVEIHTEPYTD